MSESARAPLLRAYVRSLQERNGPLIEGDLRMPQRERFLRRWRATNPGWAGAAPVAEYQRIVSGGNILPSDSRLALWMSYLAMTNQAEEYGVNVRLGYEMPEDALEAAAFEYIAREELYHTRMLLDCVRALGVEATLSRPPLGLRIFLRLFPKLPQMFTDCITLIAEAVGVTLFCQLRSLTTEFFGQTPMADHLAGALDEIIIDEVGHVTFLRCRLGESGLRWARILAPFVIPGLMRSFPMAGPLLGLDAYRRAIENFTWAKLPPSVLARAFGPWQREESLALAG